MIHLVGPGGAGKTTIGAALADRLAVPFRDLDAEFTTSTATSRPISRCMATMPTPSSMCPSILLWLAGQNDRR